MEQVLQRFGRRKDGVMVAVDEVARGLACECSCPACGSPLIAKQGEIKTWHFAHSAELDCATGAMTALHAAAQQVLIQAQGMVFPTQRVEVGTYEKHQWLSAEATRGTAWQPISSANGEVAVEGIRADVVATIQPNDKPPYDLIVEIAVTHFVDEVKLAKLEDIGLPAMEIDLSGLAFNEVDWDMLTEIIVHGIDRKIWLIKPDAQALKREADFELSRLLNLAKAKQQLQAVQPRSYRYSLGNSKLYVDEGSESVALHLDGFIRYQQFLELVDLVRRLGGRDNGYTRWLVPKSQQQQLFDALRRLKATH